MHEGCTCDVQGAQIGVWWVLSRYHAQSCGTSAKGSRLLGRVGARDGYAVGVMAVHGRTMQRALDSWEGLGLGLGSDYAIRVRSSDHRRGGTEA